MFCFVGFFYNDSTRLYYVLLLRFATHMGQVMRRCVYAICEQQRCGSVSVAEQAGLNLTWSKMPDDTFLRDAAHMIRFPRRFICDCSTNYYDSCHD